MSGLYPANAPSVYDWTNASGSGYKMTNLSASENLITRLSDQSCPSYGRVHDFVKGNQSYIDARKYYYYKYNDSMAKMVNWNSINLEQFDDTCEYMFFSHYDPNMTLNFTETAFDQAYCGAWLNGWIYEMCLALDV